ATFSRVRAGQAKLGPPPTERRFAPSPVSARTMRTRTSARFFMRGLACLVRSSTRTRRAGLPVLRSSLQESRQRYRRPLAGRFAGGTPAVPLENPLGFELANQ